MNWIYYLSFGISILLSCHSADHKPGSVSGLPDIFESKYVRPMTDTNHLMMIENVVIRFGDLYAEADSAFYEKPEKRITLFAVKKLEFQGERLEAGKQSVLYSKGDNTLTYK